MTQPTEYTVEQRYVTEQLQRDLSEATLRCSVTTAAFNAIQEEVVALRKQIAELQAQLSTQQPPVIEHVDQID